MVRLNIVEKNEWELEIMYISKKDWLKSEQMALKF